jgi:hypothetical protein
MVKCEFLAAFSPRQIHASFTRSGEDRWMRKFPFFTALALTVLVIAVMAPMSTARGEGPSTAQPRKPDDRAVLRAQVESELILRKARLTMIEQELQKQSKRYDEMAAQKIELAKITADKTEAAKRAAAEKAIKAKYATAQAGPKPVAKTAKKDAKTGDGKDAAAKDAKGGKDAGAAKGGDPGAAKQIDPMLTQNYLVLRLRDEGRQLRDRINYLESLLIRL